MIGDVSVYHQPFLDLWFSVPCRYPDTPDHSSLFRTRHDLLPSARSAFFSCRLGDSFAKGTLPVVVDLCGRTCLHLAECRPPRFRSLIRRTGDPCLYEFLLLPRDRYSLQDLAADRNALLAVNRTFAGDGGGRARLSYAGFDEEGEPVGRLSFGALSMRYLMRDRIRAAVSDLFFDKLCFFETFFEGIERLKAGKTCEYTAAWIAHVEAIVEEEMVRQHIDRTALEKQKRSMDSFIRSISRRTALPRMR